MTLNDLLRDYCGPLLVISFSITMTAASLLLTAWISIMFSRLISSEYRHWRAETRREDER